MWRPETIVDAISGLGWGLALSLFAGGFFVAGYITGADAARHDSKLTNRITDNGAFHCSTDSAGFQRCDWRREMPTTRARASEDSR